MGHLREIKSVLEVLSNLTPSKCARITQCCDIEPKSMHRVTWLFFSSVDDLYG